MICVGIQVRWADLCSFSLAWVLFELRNSHHLFWSVSLDRSWKLLGVTSLTSCACPAWSPQTRGRTSAGWLTSATARPDTTRFGLTCRWNQTRTRNRSTTAPATAHRRPRQGASNPTTASTHPHTAITKEAGSWRNTRRRMLMTALTAVCCRAKAAGQPAQTAATTWTASCKLYKGVHVKHLYNECLLFISGKSRQLYIGILGWFLKTATGIGMMVSD